LHDWRRAHEELSRLARTRARLDWEEARWLLVALRCGSHLALGFATFGEYIERLFGYSPRWTSERLRVAEALERLVETGSALKNGALSWSAARELTRVAVPETEHRWLSLVQGQTLRQIEELLSGHSLGDSPGEPSDPSTPPRHVLRFEVSADTFSTFREAMAKLRRDSGGPLDDDAGLLLMARHILGGPSDSGRASYQVALTVCEECHRGWQNGAGGPVFVDSSTVETACCDAQHVGSIPVRAPNRDDEAAPVEETTHVGIGPTPAVVAEPAHVNSASAAPAARPSRRARQDIPPAVRREVMRRDGGRCVVPGCRNGVFLDVHHIKLRSEGGDHDPDLLVVICSAHHRAAHRGQLIIEGRVSTGLRFRHADGSRYGSDVEPQMAHAHAQAFRALRILGFRDEETRRALARVRADTHVGRGSAEEVLRAALIALSTGSHVARQEATPGH
jgi:hypothetical protein